MHNLVQVHQRSKVLEHTSPFPKKLEEVRVSFKIRQNNPERMNPQPVLHCLFRLFKFSFFKSTEQNLWVVTARQQEMQRPRISLTCWFEAFISL